MTDYHYRCIDCGVEVIYQRALKTGKRARCKTHRKAYQNRRDCARKKEQREERKANPVEVKHNQVSWSSGKAIKLPKRIDALAELYRRLECWEKTANGDRGELLQLQSRFAELKAHCHVARCQALYKEGVK